MGDTFDKVLVEYQNKCPIHNIPYTGVCVENNCYETGIICPKCTPQSCIEKYNHKKRDVQTILIVDTSLFKFLRF